MTVQKIIGSVHGLLSVIYNQIIGNYCDCGCVYRLQTDVFLIIQAMVIISTYDYCDWLTNTYLAGFHLEMPHYINNYEYTLVQR